MSARKNTTLYQQIDLTLKGKELELPAGQSFFDTDGHQRTAIRIKWWEDQNTTPLAQMPVKPISGLSDQVVTDASSIYYPPGAKPVFFGHYWLEGAPTLLRDNICCLDYSVAKGGVLAAYRFDGEQQLDEGKWVFA